MNYKKRKKFYKELRKLAKKYNIPIITAVQVQQKTINTYEVIKIPQSDIMIVDYCDEL